MKAAVGDLIHIHGHKVGEAERTARIVEVHGEDGGPPYVVVWSDDRNDPPHEHTFFPGADATVEHTGSG